MIDQLLNNTYLKINLIPTLNAADRRGDVEEERMPPQQT